MTFRELASSGFYVTLLAALDRARASEDRLVSVERFELLELDHDDFEDTLPASWIVNATEPRRM